MSPSDILPIASLGLSLVTLVVAVDIYAKLASGGHSHKHREEPEDMSTPKTDAAIDRLKAALAADKNTAVADAVSKAAAEAADTSDSEAAAKVDEVTAGLAPAAAAEPGADTVVDPAQSASVNGGQGDDHLDA